MTLPIPRIDRLLPTRFRWRRRSAFTLIELVASMLSATVLLVGLAAAVSVSSSLLEVEPLNTTATTEREIQDRLATDLRYATSLTDSNSSSFSLQRLNPNHGLVEQVTYAVASNGLTRQVDVGPVMSLHASQPAYAAIPDNYAAPLAATPKFVHWRSASKQASSNSTTNLSVSLPPGCIAGDLLLLCVTGEFAMTGATVSPSGWNTLSDNSQFTLRQIVSYRYFDPSSPGPIGVTTSVATPMAAVMLAMSDAHPYSPIVFSNSAKGYSFPFAVSSHPSALQPSTSNRSRMMVQFISAENDQWNYRTFGLPTYVDAAQVLASPSSQSVALGAALRHGIDTSISSTPRVYCATFGSWVQTAVEIEVTP